MKYKRLLFLISILAVLFVACTSNPPSEEIPEEAEPTAPKYSYTTEYLRGYFEPSEHKDFVEIDTIHADRPGLYLRQDVYEAFKRMHAAAQKQNINLVIRSATRNFEYQKGIWERKWTGETKIEGGQDASQSWPNPADRALTILKYSSMPGTSRHHWGTDMDFNAFENSWFESGEGLTLYTFLQENAAEYGFCQPYTAKGNERPNGYEEEKWHWTYIPVSSELTRLAADSLKNTMIEGFKGAEATNEIDVVSNYVLGINEACK